MCRFFSFCSNDKGEPLYFNAKQRREIMKGKFIGLSYEPDSHTSIAYFYNYRAEEEDLLGKYEYNPLTKEFQIDNKGGVDNVKKMEKWVKELDFKTIVPELIIKPIMDPFTPPPKPIKIRKEQIELLKQWNLVRNSIRTSVNLVGDPFSFSFNGLVWDFIKNSVSVEISVLDLVWDSAFNLVWNSIKAFAENSVEHLALGSVRDLFGAYCSSFFNIKFDYDFSSAIKLWKQGLIPCTDGEYWYLVSKYKIEWKGKI